MTQQLQGQRLIQLGMVLFLIGLFSGFSGSFFAIPRLALSAHLEGILNGIFFAVLGLVWGAGGALMPIATGGASGTPTQDAVVTFLLLSLSAAIISALLIIIVGLRKVPEAASA